MFVESTEFYLLQGSTLSFRQSQSLSEALIESEFFSLLEAGKNKAPGAGKTKIASNGKKYVERVDKMLKKIDKDPEAALNDPEFIDLVQNFDATDNNIRSARAKMLGITDEQIKPTDIRIFNRFRKGENLFTVIQEEYSKTFDRFDTAFDDNGTSILTLVAVIIVNSFVIQLLVGKFGFHLGFLLGATFCAPITEEIGRQITGNTGKRSFSYAINMVEYVQYVLQAFVSGGIVVSLITLVWRTIFSTNLHQINETHIHSAKLKNIVTGRITSGQLNTAGGWTLVGNMTRHALANGLSLIFQPLLILWELVAGQNRNKTHIELSESFNFNDSQTMESLFEGATITTSGGLEIDLQA